MPEGPRPGACAFRVPALIGITAVCHALVLPLGISYDGQLYIDHARALFTSRFWSDWDFLRTPLYPFYLRIAFELFGTGPQAILIAGSILAATGSVLFVAAARPLVGPRALIAVAVLLAVNPIFVGYAHLALSEVASLLHLALLIWVATRMSRWGWNPTTAGGLGLLLALAYYCRPTFLYFSPLVGLVSGVSLLLTRKGGFAPRWVELLNATATPALVCALLAAPWMVQRGVRARQDEPIVFALVKQGLLPEGSPVLARDVSDRYREALAASREGPRLPDRGVRDELALALIGPVRRGIHQPVAWFFVKTALQNPARYAGGIWRTLRLLMFLPRPGSDTVILMQLVFEPRPAPDSGILPGPAPLDPYTRRTFAMVHPGSPLARACVAAIPLFRWLYLGGALASCLGIVLALRNRDPALLAVTALPLAYVGLHALLLFSVDRMAVPAQPLIVANLAVVPAAWARAFSRRALP